jgi:opacity protein-like surface antigen
MRKVLVVLGLVMFSAGLAHAGDCSLVDTTASYDYVRVNTTIVVSNGYGQDTLSSTGNLNGWNAEGAYNVTCWLGVVAQFSGLYGSPTFDEVPVNTHIYTSLFGPRVNWHNPTPFTPFVEGLVGVAHANFVANEVDFSETENKVSAAVGAGVDVRVMHHVALRLEADDLITTFANQTQNSARVIGAVVIKWGSH